MTRQRSENICFVDHQSTLPLAGLGLAGGTAWAKPAVLWNMLQWWRQAEGVASPVAAITQQQLVGVLLCVQAPTDLTK
jgi:hypothetical protein